MRFDGTLNSRITSRPPGFSTRSISSSPRGRFSKFRTPKATVTTSKVLSSNRRFSASPTSAVTVTFPADCGENPAFSTFSRITFSIPSDKSTPVTVAAVPAVAAGSRKHVLAARSRTAPLRKCSPAATAGTASARAMASEKSPVPQATSSTCGASAAPTISRRAFRRQPRSTPNDIR